MTGTSDTERERLYRLPDRGWLGGVCAGLAERLTLDLTAIRIIAVILTIGSGGLFLLVYAVAWAVMPVAPAAATGPSAATDGDANDEAAGSWGWRRARADAETAGPWIRRPRNGVIRLGLGVTLLTLGILLAFRELGLWWSDAVIWPIVLAAGGAALILRQIQVSGEHSETPSAPGAVGAAAVAEADAMTGPASATASAEIGAEAAGLAGDRPGSDPERGRASAQATPGRIRAILRLYRGGFGVALVLAATILFLYANGVFGEVGEAALVVLAITAAAGLILTPFLLATARRAQEERRQRIRSQERAEVAAHLHDSVLQTLAMIQRRAGDSAEIATLARRQERELRAWLSGRGDEERSASLAAALEQAASEVEEAHQVPVETVTVGDRPLNRRGDALVAATREAVTNAARFAGGTGGAAATGGPVSVFAELSPEQATVFIRDRGPGFELDSVPADRRGVRESIIGRMERHGGSATIRSRPGEGTEVELSMEFT